MLSGEANYLRITANYDDWRLICKPHRNDMPIRLIVWISAESGSERSLRQWPLGTALGTDSPSQAFANGRSLSLAALICRIDNFRA
jgi:hypothetical protein